MREQDFSGSETSLTMDTACDVRIEFVAADGALTVLKAISEMTSTRWETTDLSDRVSQLNRLIIGWANYFSLGSVSKAYRAVDRHACQRLRQWLRRKHKVDGRGCSHFPDELL